MYKKYYTFSTLFLAMILVLTAQEEDSIAKRKIGVLPVPTFGFEPETRWYGGAVALFTFNVFDSARTSNADIEFSYTQNKQLIFDFQWDVFTSNEQFLLNGIFEYSKYPDLFYGIGNDTKLMYVEPYDSKRTRFQSLVAVKISPGTYAGLDLVYEQMYDIDYSDTILFNSNLFGREGSQFFGLGLALIKDYRDNLLNTQKGVYIKLSGVLFNQLSQSNLPSRFVRFELDARSFTPLFQKHVLAAQFYSMVNMGTPPFNMLALLGSDSHMRGYYKGRYRDLRMVTTQLEYRVPLFWRIGVAAFGGLGNVKGLQLGSSWFDGIKPTFGGGILFLMDKQENVNLRLDMAWGVKGAQGFYVAFGEAF